MQFSIETLSDISREDLRRLLIFRCADKFVTKDSLEHIYQNGLYDTDLELKNLSEHKLENAVIGLLKPSRVAHVLGCRDTAVKLAEVWKANPVDASRAALLHDITKALDGPLQLELCAAYSVILDDFSTENTKTLHALTGSLVADRIFGENQEVVSAIRSHTTGKENMNTLEKIIYVADYVEPNRDFPGVDELRALAFEDLDQALKLGLQMTITTLKEQGKEISPASQRALAFLENEKGNHIC